jgi:hypothetical protein
VAAGLKEGQARETIEELEGILTYKGKARLVSIRQGVLMIYSLNEDGKVPPPFMSTYHHHVRATDRQGFTM